LTSISISDFLKKYGKFMVKRSKEKSRWHMPQLWDVTSYEYLDFAVKDLESGDSKKNRVNAVSNAKRALHRRIDTLIHYFWLGFKSQQKRWNFPTKIHTLEKLGIATPDVLSKLNKHRNLIEHEYQEPPEKDQIKDFIGMVELFLSSTNPFLETPLEFVIDGTGLSFVFDLENGIIFVKEKRKIKEELHIGKDEAWLDLPQLLISDKMLVHMRIRELGYTKNKERALKEIKKEISQLIKAKYP